jgi:hypothetical protein
VAQLKKAGKKAPALREECIEFADMILAKWKENPYGHTHFGDEPTPLLPSLAALDEPRLIKVFLSEVLVKDSSVDPGKGLATVCQKHGWATFQPELEALFKNTTAATLPRHIGMLEQLCLAKPRNKEGWPELCQALAGTIVEALERIDRGRDSDDWQLRLVKRSQVLAGLARALIATDQDELLGQVIEHALALPKRYPLTEAHVAALIALRRWIEANVKRPCPPLSRWIAACGEQLEALTGQEPQPPADFRRPSALTCKCADCGEINRFLNNPKEQTYRFSAAQNRRDHVTSNIINDHADLDLKTEEKGRPYTLICTKNTRSYQASVKKYHQELEHLATIRQIQASVPKGKGPRS